MRAINVPVLAATNRDLLADVHAARFRQDFYYRLRAVEVIVPPLRERRDDILPLARQLLAGAAKRRSCVISMEQKRLLTCEFNRLNRRHRAPLGAGRLECRAAERSLHRLEVAIPDPPDRRDQRAAHAFQQCV